MNFKLFRPVFPTILIMLSTTTLLYAQTIGEQWEYHGNMQMMGMSMPVPSTRICQPIEEDITPLLDGNCEVTNVQTQGNTTSFSIRCGEPEPMEGSGTTTRTDNHIDMKYSMKSPAGEMAFAMTGTKLGACTL